MTTAMPYFSTTWTNPARESDKQPSESRINRKHVPGFSGARLASRNALPAVVCFFRRARHGLRWHNCGHDHRSQSPQPRSEFLHRRPVSALAKLGCGVLINEGEIDGDHLVDVLWNGKAVMMFTQDIRMRGALVDGE